MVSLVAARARKALHDDHSYHYLTLRHTRLALIVLYQVSVSDDIKFIINMGIRLRVFSQLVQYSILVLVQYTVSFV